MNITENERYTLEQMRLMSKYHPKSVSVVDLSAGEIFQESFHRLKNMRRWGGGFDNALSVIGHQYLTMEILRAKYGTLAGMATYKFRGNPDLRYGALCFTRSGAYFAALHHDITEGLGVGDITAEVKKHIVQGVGRDAYNLYNDYVSDKCQIYSFVHAGMVKCADLVAGIVEANLLGLDIDSLYPDMPTDTKRELSAAASDFMASRIIDFSTLNNDADELFLDAHNKLAKELGVNLNVR